MSRFTRIALATVAFAAAATPAHATQLSSENTLKDADGNAIHAFSCSWSDGAPEGRDCRDSVGDAPYLVELVKRYDAASLESTQRSADGTSEHSQTVHQRADGTWLMRGRGTAARGGAPARSYEWGFVCAASGTGCVPWVVSRLESDRTTVRAASAKAAIRKATNRVKR